MTASATKSIDVSSEEYTQISQSEAETQQHGITIFSGPQDMLRVIVGGDGHDAEAAEFISLSAGKSLFISGHEREMRDPDHAPHLPNVWVRAEYKDTSVVYVIGDAKVMISG